MLWTRQQQKLKRDKLFIQTQLNNYIGYKNNLKMQSIKYNIIIRTQNTKTGCAEAHRGAQKLIVLNNSTLYIVIH